MGAISERNRFCHDLLPRQLRQMILRRRRMADDLKTVVQTAIMLAVKIFFVTVSDRQNLLRVASNLPTLVDLQLHAEKALTGSVEMRLRMIVIVVNDLILQNVIAAFAVGVIIAVFQIVRFIVGNDGAAAFAVGIVTIKAALAERVTAVSAVLICPDPFAAIGANHRLFVQTGFAEKISCKQGQFLFLILPSADTARMIFSHHNSPSNKKITTRNFFRVVSRR